MFSNSFDQRSSDNDYPKREIPSFIEPRPPLITNPFNRPKPTERTNLLHLFEEDSDSVEPELVQVYLRVKPCNVPNALYEIRNDQCLITSVDSAPMGNGRRTQNNVNKMYTFSHIFGPERTQKEIFNYVVKDNLRKLPEGQNYTLLTYGASGSGKTYTLMGTESSPGLVPRSLEYIFKLVDAAQRPIYRPCDGRTEQLTSSQQDHELQWVKKVHHISTSHREKYRRMSSHLSSDFSASTFDLTNKTRYYVWVSFIEIYNEAIYDLLVPSDRRTTSKLYIREDINGQVYIKGVTQVFVRSGEEAYDVMVAGKHNLQVAATGIHAHSSRSHCIFTVTMLTETPDGVKTSFVRLCDLAGSERANRTGNTGTRLAESRAINSSLHVLERCLHMLRRKQRQRHELSNLIPYRESKLTRLLGSGLSGTRGEAITMVVTVNPSPDYIQETKHVLQLASVAKDIQVNNTIYESSLESSSQDTTITSNVEVMKLRAEKERLQFELVQSMANYKKLMVTMEERRKEATNTMKELVDEAKDMTKEFYVGQLEALEERLRSEMDDLVEGYERKLQIKTASDNGGLSENKVGDLINIIISIEDELKTKKLMTTTLKEKFCQLYDCVGKRDQENESSPQLKDNDSVNESNADDQFAKERRLTADSTYSRDESMRRDTLNTISIDSSELRDNSSYVDDIDNDTYNSVEVNTNDVTDKCNSNNLNCNNISSQETSFKNSTFGVDDDGEKKEHIDNISTSYISCKLTKEHDETKEEDYETNSETKEDDLNADEIEPIVCSKNNDFQRGDVETAIKKSTNLESINAMKNSLILFEQYENEVNDDINPTNTIEKEINIVELSKIREKKIYFDNVDNTFGISKNIIAEIRCNSKIDINTMRSPSIIKDDIPTNYNPSTIRKLLGSTVKDPCSPLSACKKHLNKQNSMDLFDDMNSPQIQNNLEDKIENCNNISLEYNILKVKHEKDHYFLYTSNPGVETTEISNDITENKDIDMQRELSIPHTLVESLATTRENNTVEEFETIYKDLSASRATEFELLVSKENSKLIDNTVSEDTTRQDDKHNKYNLRCKFEIESNNINVQKLVDCLPENIKINEDLESTNTNKVKVQPKRNLRLRRKKNESDENTTILKEKTIKFDNIENLKHEYCDVTMDMPATKTILKDIPSPAGEEENLPPLKCVQSCPSKSVTRSRRKLFTPRPEPLDESASAAGNSNERLRVPRPSYHRGRARRKL